MKVKINRNVEIKTAIHMASSEIQVLDELGKELLEASNAEEVKAPKAEAKKTDTKRSDK